MPRIRGQTRLALIEANKAVDKAAAELDAALNAANQAYGNASIQCSLDFGRPLATYKYVSCYFGGNGHRGTDYAAPGGTEIYAVSGGVVYRCGLPLELGLLRAGLPTARMTTAILIRRCTPTMNSAPVVSVGPARGKGRGSWLCRLHRQLHRQPSAPGNEGQTTSWSMS